MLIYWKYKDGSSPPEYCMYLRFRRYQVWEFLTCKTKKWIRAEGALGTVDEEFRNSGGHVCVTTKDQVVNVQEQLIASGFEEYIANPGTQDSWPADPPTTGNSSDDLYNCIGGAIGGGTSGDLTIPPPSSGESYPNPTTFWVNPADAVDLFKDDCWELITPCDIGSAPGEGTVVLFVEGPLKEDGSKGPVTHIAHATTSNGDGSFSDKNGSNPAEPNKPASEVVEEHTTDRGFSDADGDGTYKNDEAQRWREIKCYWYDEDCAEEGDDE